MGRRVDRIGIEDRRDRARPRLDRREQLHATGSDERQLLGEHVRRSREERVRGVDPPAAGLVLQQDVWIQAGKLTRTPRVPVELVSRAGVAPRRGAYVRARWITATTSSSPSTWSPPLAAPRTAETSSLVGS